MLLCALPCSYCTSAVTATRVFSFSCVRHGLPTFATFRTFQVYGLRTASRNLFGTFLVAFPIPYSHYFGYLIASGAVIYACQIVIYFSTFFYAFETVILTLVYVFDFSLKSFAAIFAMEQSFIFGTLTSDFWINGIVLVPYFHYFWDICYTAVLCDKSLKSFSYAYRLEAFRASSFSFYYIIRPRLKQLTAFYAVPVIVIVAITTPILRLLCVMLISPHPTEYRVLAYSHCMNCISHIVLLSLS